MDKTHHATIRREQGGLGEYVLESQLWVPTGPEGVFDFFADAHNLNEITPPWLGFRILTPQPIEMRAGTLIDYQLRLRFIPIRWRTEITVWEPPFRFVDSQQQGPYRLWHHEHTFVASNGGTLVRDVVRYRPLGGRLIHWLFVKSDLLTIFDYRHEMLQAKFG